LPLAYLLRLFDGQKEEEEEDDDGRIVVVVLVRARVIHETVVSWATTPKLMLHIFFGKFVSYTSFNFYFIFCCPPVIYLSRSTRFGVLKKNKNRQPRSLLSLPPILRFFGKNR
jgi:hypothetical protein